MIANKIRVLYNLLKARSEDSTQRLIYVLNISLFVVCGFVGFEFMGCTKESACSTKGDVILTLDWSFRGEGIEVPESLSLFHKGYKYTHNANESFKIKLDTGYHDILIYNPVDHITVKDNIVSVSGSDGLINSKPGWLFYSNLKFRSTADSPLHYTVVMIQHVRQLNIVLNILGDNGLIGDVEAKLSGVAGSYDTADNMYGGSSEVVPIFDRVGDKLVSSLRLLGVLNNEQQLFQLLVNSTKTEQELVNIDLSDKFENFNIDKHIPHTISADLSLRIDAEGHFTADISNWQVVDGGEISGT